MAQGKVQIIEIFRHFNVTDSIITVKCKKAQTNLLVVEDNIVLFSLVGCKRQLIL